MDAPPPKVHDLGLKIMKTNPQLAAVTLELERTRNSRYHPALSIRYHPRAPDRISDLIAASYRMPVQLRRWSMPEKKSQRKMFTMQPWPHCQGFMPRYWIRNHFWKDFSEGYQVHAGIWEGYLLFNPAGQ
jgi:hypothetical protein